MNAKLYGYMHITEKENLDYY